MQRSTTNEARRSHRRTIQLLHLLPTILALAAFIITFLCLFAGGKPNFMSDYPTLTVSPHGLHQHSSSKLSLTPSSIPHASHKTSRKTVTPPALLPDHKLPPQQPSDSRHRTRSVPTSPKTSGIADFYTVYN